MMAHSISEVCIGEVYDRDELFALSDFFVQDGDLIFGSVLNNACFRAERDDIHKDKWVVKEFFVTEG